MNPSKQDIAERARAALAEVSARRRAARDDRRALEAVKQFQSARMAVTHADLLAGHDTRAAAEFFLDDLYGIHDQSRRDADLERVIPVMERLLPKRALEAVAQAIVLDALSEMLDAQMADALGARFSATDYASAYLNASNVADRARQIELVAEVGAALCELIRVPLLGSTLKMMRKPAEMAGLGELQQFLERGFSAFKGMRAPGDFVATVVERERAILARLQAGEPEPFGHPFAWPAA